MPILHRNYLNIMQIYAIVSVHLFSCGWTNAGLENEQTYGTCQALGGGKMAASAMDPYKDPTRHGDYWKKRRGFVRTGRSVAEPSGWSGPDDQASPG